MSHMALATKLSRRVAVRQAGRAVAALALTPLLGCDERGRARHLSDAATSDASSGDAHDAALDAPLDADLGPMSCAPLLQSVDSYARQFGGRSTIDGWQQPDLDADSWRVAIGGLVRTPMSFGLKELEAERAHHVTVLSTLQCVFGPWATALWTGVPLRRLLDRAGIDRTSTRRLRFVGADGFAASAGIDDVYAPEAGEAFDTLLAFRMGGQPLPKDLGYPARLIHCGRFGFKHVKWLVSVEATDREEPFGQYESAGLSDSVGMSPLATGLTEPRPASFKAGPISVCGYATSGYSGIVAVEVALDGGEFVPAQIPSLQRLRRSEPALEQALQVRDPARYPWPPRGVWVPWEYTWTATAGDHQLFVRARDRAGGVTQPSALYYRVEA